MSFLFAPCFDHFRSDSGHGSAIPADSGHEVVLRSHLPGMAEQGTRLGYLSPVTGVELEGREHEGAAPPRKPVVTVL